jgi:hypothetical protein
MPDLSTLTTRIRNFMRGDYSAADALIDELFPKLKDIAAWEIESGTLPRATIPYRTHQ